MNQDSAFSNFPKGFNQKLFFEIYRHIGRGQSMLISAPPGMGKTLTLRLVTENAEMNHTFLPKDKIVGLSLNADQSEGDSGRDLLRKLLIEAQGKLETTPDFSVFEEKDQTIIFERLKFTLNKIIKNDCRVVITIDHIEKICSDNFSGFFSALKAIRELAREKISFIFIADSNLLKSASFEKFSAIQSILVENVITLNPLDKKDSEIFIKQVEKIMDCKISDKERTKIIETCGGFPRLMKRLTILVSDGESLTKLIENPESDNKLRVDLQKILNYVEINPESNFKIPLLENFRNQHGPTQEKIDKVQFTSRLTRQEYALAKLLIDQAGELINREQMIKAVWPKNLYETSEHALDQMIHRLRLKLEAATPACHLLTYRGRGCKLTIN